MNQTLIYDLLLIALFFLGIGALWWEACGKERRKEQERVRRNYGRLGND